MKPLRVKLRTASVFKCRFENPRPPPETRKFSGAHLRQHGRLFARRELRHAFYVRAVFIAKRRIIQEIGNSQQALARQQLAPYRPYSLYILERSRKIQPLSVTGSRRLTTP